MGTLNIRLPNSVHKRLKEFADRDGVSMNQFVATAVAEKLASLATMEYIEQRAQRGSKERFRAILDKAPDREPEEHDKM